MTRHNPLILLGFFATLTPGCLALPAAVTCYDDTACAAGQVCQVGQCVLSGRPDGRPGADALTDARVDALAVDARVDALVVDARVDALADAGVDALADATVDAQADAQADAGADADPSADPDASFPGTRVAGYLAEEAVPLHEGAGDLQVAIAWADSAWVIAWSAEVSGRRHTRVVCVAPSPAAQPPVFELDEGPLLPNTASRPAIAVGPDGFRVARPVPVGEQNRIRIAHFALPVDGRCANPLTDPEVLPDQDPAEVFLVAAGDHPALVWQTRSEPNTAARLAWLSGPEPTVIDLAQGTFASHPPAWHPGLARLGYTWEAYVDANLGWDLFFRTVAPDATFGFERVAATSPGEERGPWPIADGAGFGLLAFTEDPIRRLEYHPLQADGGPAAERQLLGHLPPIALGHGPPAFDPSGTLAVAWQGVGDGTTPSLDLSLRPPAGTFQRLRLANRRTTSVAVAGGPGGFAVVFVNDHSVLELIEVR